MLKMKYWVQRTGLLSLEADIFAEVREFLSAKLAEVQKTASAVASVDVLCSFAEVSIRNST